MEIMFLTCLIFSVKLKNTVEIQAFPGIGA
jgi:hypothetical protein